jgi:RNA polymerase sigma-70 factor (ECF subfamily)
MSIVSVVGRIHSQVERSDEQSAVDRALMVRLRSGDEAAMNQLLRQYWSPLVAYVTSLINDRAQAEDVVQDTFLDLWNRSGAWDVSGSLAAFLYKVARHLALNQARRRRVRLRRAWHLKREADSRRPPTALDTIERVELAAAINEAIRGLPPRRGEVFTLGYLHELKHSEIAAAMGISVQTVKNHMSAALGQLRRSLGPFLE